MKKIIAISASQVKKIREITSAGILDSKKALVASDGDMKKAIEWLQKNGAAKAMKKSGRIAAEGIVKSAVNGNKAIIIEVNSETDFVANNDNFIKTVNSIMLSLLKTEPKSLEEALKIKIDSKTIEQHLTFLTSTIGENIKMRRFIILNKENDQSFGYYNHSNSKISVVLIIDKINQEEVGKDISMHIAAMNPQYISDKLVGEKKIEEIKKNLILELEDADKKKPKEILMKHIIPGKLRKHLSQITLYGQQYVKDPDITVGNMLKNNNCNVINFIRYELAEGIKKQELNFKDEVEKAKKISNE